MNRFSPPEHQRGYAYRVWLQSTGQGPWYNGLDLIMGFGLCFNKL